MYIHISLKGVYNIKKNDKFPVEKGTALKIYGQVSMHSITLLTLTVPVLSQFDMLNYEKYF